MEADLRLHKRRYNNALQAIKVMLVNKRRALPEQEWLEVVDKVKERVIAQPHEYLTDATLPADTMALLVNDIFNQFVKDQQTRRSRTGMTV